MRNAFRMVMVLQNSVDQMQVFEEYVFWAEKSIEVGSIVGEIYISVLEVPSVRNRKKNLGI